MGSSSSTCMGYVESLSICEMVPGPSTVMTRVPMGSCVKSIILFLGEIVKKEKWLATCMWQFRNPSEFTRPNHFGLLHDRYRAHHYSTPPGSTRKTTIDETDQQGQNYRSS